MTDRKSDPRHRRRGAGAKVNGQADRHNDTGPLASTGLTLDDLEDQAADHLADEGGDPDDLDELAGAVAFIAEEVGR